MSQFLAKLNNLYNNLLEFYNKFGESMSSNLESVTTYQLTSDGSISTMQIPSIGYYISEVKTLNQQINAMLYANDNQIALQFQDGSVKKFEMQQLSQLVQTLESVENMSFTAPTDFKTKTNWFFESFLNPLMSVDVNVSALLVQTDIQKFSVRRVITMPSDSSQENYFDQSIKGRTDLAYDELLVSLDNEGITYHIDDNLVDMPVAINRYRGSFTVVRINEQTVTDTSGNVNTQMVYQLDTLSYYDLISGTATSAVLAVGDTLVTSDDTEYVVDSVNKSDNTVVLVKNFGIGTISLGTDQLRMRPESYRIPYLQVNVGYNEREIIFISPVSAKLDFATDKWSNGFAIYTNELNVTLSNGTVLDMTTYYKNFVSDFGMMFMSYAKEKQVPSVLAVTPNVPTLSAGNFSVVDTNSHITQSQNAVNLKAQIAAKEQLQNQLDEIDKTISTLKAQYNDSSTTSDIVKQKLQKSIDQNLITKTSILNQLASTIQQITLNIKSQPTFTADAVYSVRGFWDMPDPIDTTNGTQSVIQFKIQYRYLSKTGTSSNVNQLSYTGNTGQSKYGFFSNWNEQVTKIRQKEYDTTKGIYIWSDENLQDPDVVNINQVDIPINKGEAVEIRVKSVSEAGFPINPAESDWCTSVIVPFPDDLEATTENSILTEQIFLDNAVVEFQQQLNSMGLDVHLLNSLYTGDKYWAHKTDDIASGFYTSAGSIKSLLVVLQEIYSSISAIQSSLTSDYGTLAVTVTDGSGNATNVKNGDTVSLFAGYYKDLIKDSSNVLQHGEVITSTYVVSLSNTSATVLELASRIIGGVDERAPFDDSAAYPEQYDSYPSWIAGDTDYTRNRVYDKVPLLITAASDNAIGDFKQQSPQQSGQVCGQFVYGRYRDYGLSRQLYFDDYAAMNSRASAVKSGFLSITGVANYLNAQAPYEVSYLYQGKGFSTVNNASYYTPSNGYMYFPFDNYNKSAGFGGKYGPINQLVWAGNTSTAGSPDGFGAISEFAIHVNHPDIQSVGVTVDSLCRPAISTTGQSYVKIAHALHFNTTVDEKTDVFGAAYYQQCKYRQAIPYDTSTSPTLEHKYYPIKNGFNVNDTYLIGKYTCGAYLTLAPNTYDVVLVDGNSPKYAKKDIVYNGSSINIPVIFQFRCSDKLGYIGGYRLAGDLQNVKYTKKIGIDIYERDVTKKSIALVGDIFSFDVEVSCQYSNTTNIVTPITLPSSQMSRVSYPAS